MQGHPKGVNSGSPPDVINILAKRQKKNSNKSILKTKHIKKRQKKK